MRRVSELATTITWGEWDTAHPTIMHQHVGARELGLHHVPHTEEDGKFMARLHKHLARNHVPTRHITSGTITHESTDRLHRGTVFIDPYNGVTLRIYVIHEYAIGGSICEEYDVNLRGRIAEEFRAWTENHHQLGRQRLGLQGDADAANG